VKQPRKWGPMPALQQDSSVLDDDDDDDDDDVTGFVENP
jgi:hypothetical protein